MLCSLALSVICWVFVRASFLQNLKNLGHFSLTAVSINYNSGVLLVGGGGGLGHNFAILCNIYNILKIVKKSIKKKVHIYKGRNKSSDKDECAV